MDFTVAKTTKYYFCGVTNEAAEVAAARRVANDAEANRLVDPPYRAGWKISHWSLG